MGLGHVNRPQPSIPLPTRAIGASKKKTYLEPNVQRTESVVVLTQLG